MFIGGFFIYYHKPHRTIYYGYLLNYEFVDLLNLNQENKCQILTYILIKRFFCLDLLCCPCITTYGFIDKSFSREPVNPPIEPVVNSRIELSVNSRIDPMVNQRIEPSVNPRIETRRPSRIDVISSRPYTIQPTKESDMERAIQNSRVENVRRYDNIPIATPIDNV